MTCGHLGCGRKNYDGSGGNGHAKAHCEESQHVVALKLGTITPEGSASIYCYACDEDVVDDNLGVHLSNLGIDILRQTKTEKTITELNLEANLSLTLSKVLEEGKILVPVFGPGYTGMENLGNTCYMNAVVQCLFSFPNFQNYFFPNALDHLQNCSRSSPDCYQC
jgi:ubiquitin carboxyl-terminal hydrolase 5/13